MMKIPEDKEFLLLQRSKSRKGSMSTVDAKLAGKEARSAKRLLQEAKRRERVTPDITEGPKSKDKSSKILVKTTKSDIPSTSSGTSKAGSRVNLTPSSRVIKKRGGKNVLTPNLVATLDTAKVSVRKGTAVIAASASAMGMSIANVSVNKSSLHRAKTRLRKENAQMVKNSFKQKAAGRKLTVHWDGKKMKTGQNSSNFEERLPVVVTGHNLEEQLLGAPRLEEATGEAQSNAVEDILDEWDLSECIEAMCADTTASNTGSENGACVKIRRRLRRKLLYATCRHHMFEIVLKGVFQETVAVSSGPDILIFKRFRESWSKIDQTAYDSGIDDPEASSYVQLKAEEVIAFVTEKLATDHARDDYREFLELVCIYLGGTPARGVKFAAPGALHEARFMARAIYSLKMLLFKKQVALSKREERGLRDFCLFVVTVYVKAWFTAPSAIAAPNQDLEFLRALDEYKTIDQRVAEVAVKKFRNHLWYLTNEGAALSLLDDRVSLDAKRSMLEAMKLKEPSPDDSGNPLRLTVSMKDIPQLNTKHIWDFVDFGSANVFKRFNLSTEFLDQDPSKWEELGAFQEARAFFSDFRVVNDAAERAVALTQEYLGQVKSEENYQDLLLVAQCGRRETKDKTKSQLGKDLF